MSGHLAWLQAQLIRNRFLPIPPQELMFCGDGDYRAIGAEFLGHFVRLADLQPHERMLDIGCGIGRMAVPLTQYLCEDGRYIGVDIVPDGINWCRRAISPAYPNFEFTDRKSTRLNSSHMSISYAVFCLKKKKKKIKTLTNSNCTN